MSGLGRYLRWHGTIEVNIYLALVERKIVPMDVYSPEWMKLIEEWEDACRRILGEEAYMKSRAKYMAPPSAKE